MKKYAEIQNGKVIAILEANSIADLAAIFGSKPYWVDVTELDCEVGYNVALVNGHITFSAPVIDEKEPTIEEIRKTFSDKLGQIMDEKAQEYGYDSIITAVTYENSDIEKFRQEGTAFRKWRDLVYATAYSYLDEVLAGKKTLPQQNDEVMALLPDFILEEGRNK